MLPARVRPPHSSTPTSLQGPHIPFALFLTGCVALAKTSTLWGLIFPSVKYVQSSPHMGLGGTMGSVEVPWVLLAL